MKTIVKAGSLIAMLAIMTSSCSVERKTRHGKKNVIDVGMNKKEIKTNQVLVYNNHSITAIK